MANWSKAAQVLLEGRYLRKDETGKVIETPDEMLVRVAKAVAAAEDKNKKEWEDKFLSQMDSLDFLPGTPTLINAGRNFCLSSCFVIPVEDSIESIYEALKRTAIISKMGGGVGVSFSKLRPEGGYIKTTGGTSSGVISFMSLWDTSASVVKQGGIRRGALMGVLDVRHKEIEKFIACKEGNGHFQNFNISVSLTDEFINKALSNKWHWLSNPNDPNDKVKVSAAGLFERIAHHAWSTGEPGVLFIDTINRGNPLPYLGKITGTNPCGEEPLLPHEACNLASIDVSKFVLLDKRDFDWDRLRGVIRTGVRFMDNVISINTFPYVKIKTATERTRKIGLGIMGWADALVRLRIKYGEIDSFETAEKLMSFIQREATIATEELAIERGPFPAYRKNGRGSKEKRNGALLCIAPTGSISILAGCSSGVEPHYDFSHTKRILGDKDITISVNDDTATKDDVVCAHDLAPEQHVQMVSAFQKYLDGSISKTINLPATATVGDVKNVYLLAHRLGCKSITVYRDETRDAPLRKSKCQSEECVLE